MSGRTLNREEIGIRETDSAARNPELGSNLIMGNGRSSASVANPFRSITRQHNRDFHSIGQARIAQRLPIGINTKALLFVEAIPGWKRLCTKFFYDTNEVNNPCT